MVPLRLRMTDDVGKSIPARWTWLQPGEQRLWKRVPMYVLPLALVPAGLGALVWLAITQGPWVLAVTLFGPVAYALLFAGFAIALWARRSLKDHLERVKARQLARGCCPACRYDISTCERDAESMLRCPECGGSWRIDSDDPVPRVVRLTRP